MNFDNLNSKALESEIIAFLQRNKGSYYTISEIAKNFGVFPERIRYLISKWSFRSPNNIKVLPHPLRASWQIQKS